MHIFSVFLVIVGLIALILSLIPLTSICSHDTRYRWGWGAMFALVLIFILGYLFFCYHLMFKVPDVIDFILAGIFAGGGLFVVLVSRMSLASLNELKAIALEHEQQALHDALTGLPNRKSLMMTLENTISASGRVDACFAVMVMDLNGFKEVNDTLGHQAGDLALQVIAPRLSKQLRESDTLCRMGGDEFAVILPQTGKAESRLVAKKMLAATAEALSIENNKIILGISIGIALSPDHALDGNSLLRYADIAMYQAKHQKSGVEVYSREIDKSSIDKLSGTPEILQALKEKKLITYFQPVFIEDQLKGLEVSLSWHKEGEAVVMAQDFLKSIVDLGASWPLIEYVVDEAFLNFSQWRQEFDTSFNLRLNMFLGTINKDEVSDFLVSKARQFGIPTDQIMIEISESMLSRLPIIKLMNKLHLEGFKIAVDDFGSNGAKLLLLKRSELDEVKLDSMLAQKLQGDLLDVELIRSLLAYCEKMQLPLVVPSVENQLGLDELKEIGISHYQGDFLCPFLTAENMTNWLTHYFQQSRKYN